ncbi:hypothetical protein [Klebsiella sp. BIGb0407]|uniref:hypothetical protein n=1 Tax=Klebsiella sp. BIGb0407 TaxID=2940603 RepID=UPI002167D72B|nr:hypothetical protein [Klebsiella sp. BIGb0407]MCS3432995.1 hypothetical protein [Klebsiella sp. BIGb0407]
MQIVDFFRAAVLKSSDSAFRLALDSDENINFARTIISAKNKGAHTRLTKLKPKEINFHYTLMKTKKYDAFLMMIDYLEKNNSEVTMSRYDNGDRWWFTRS